MSPSGFDPHVPLEEAWTPPSSWYLDPEHLAREGRSVFRSNWVAVGRADAVREPGDSFTGQLLDEPFVVVRGTDGVLRAHANVCKHHGAVIARSEAKLERLVCPYHGWTYGLDGALESAPRAGGMRCFDRADFGLDPIAVAEWGPLVFLCQVDTSQGDAPRDLAADLSELERRLAAFGSSFLRFAAHREYELDCNWKVFVDNYLDGGYHVPVLHEALAGQLDLSEYRSELFERWNLQSCPGAAVREGGDLAERLGEAALYAWVHPNVMLNRYGPVLDTNVVLPLGHDRCLVAIDYWFEEGSDSQDFVDRCLEASDRVQREDVEICASVQRGLRSSAYDRGRYAPAFEAPMLHFHRLLAEDLSAPA